MTGASDKARFYLEQSVPELHELLRKKIFSEVGNHSTNFYYCPLTDLLARNHLHCEKALRFRAHTQRSRLETNPLRALCRI